MEPPRKKDWNEFYGELNNPKPRTRIQPFELRQIIRSSTEKMKAQRMINTKLLTQIENQEKQLEQAKIVIDGLSKK